MFHILKGLVELDDGLPNTPLNQRTPSDPPYVLVPRLLVKSQVFVQPEPDVVPVQSVCEFLGVEEVLFECTGDRRLRVDSRFK